jgi:hypothetical protein
MPRFARITLLHHKTLCDWCSDEPALGGATDGDETLCEDCYESHVHDILKHCGCYECGRNVVIDGGVLIDDEEWFCVECSKKHL